MAATDKILQEAQNIMALQNTDTPLKAALKSTLVFNLNLNLLDIWIDMAFIKFSILIKILPSPN